MTRKTLLFINEYGIYPELVHALQSTDYEVTVEHLMRKAIKFIKKNDPEIVVAEFMHEPQFRDRVSNLESMLAQIEGRNKTRTIVLYHPDHQDYLDRVCDVFTIDTCLIQPVSGDQLLDAVAKLKST
ncbi:MAG: hypothetical protein ACWA44_12385 [Thiotrichales bacterium]